MGDGWRARLRGRRGPVDVVVAVGQPLLLVGAAVVGARLGAFPAGAGAEVVQAVLVPVVGVLWVASVALDAHPVALFLGGIAGVVALLAVLNGTEAAALHERGERTSCAVAAVTERIERSAHVRADDRDAPAQWPNPPFPPPAPPVSGPGFDPIDDFDHDTTTTWYDYRLACDRGPVTALSLTSRPAGAGNRLEVVYDPLQLVGPVPADDYTDSDGSVERLVAVAATVVMIAVRLVGTLWSSRDGYGPRRWRRRRGRW
jgi:hypothetical protein